MLREDSIYEPSLIYMEIILIFYYLIQAPFEPSLYPLTTVLESITPDAFK